MIASQADPKAVSGRKADIGEIVSLTAAIDQAYLLHVRIQIVCARFQCLWLHAALALARKQLVRLLRLSCGEIVMSPL